MGDSNRTACLRPKGLQPNRLDRPRCGKHRKGRKVVSQTFFVTFLTRLPAARYTKGGLWAFRAGTVCPAPLTGGYAFVVLRANGTGATPAAGPFAFVRSLVGVPVLAGIGRGGRNWKWVRARGLIIEEKTTVRSALLRRPHWSWHGACHITLSISSRKPP